jgi:signal transduction histidine kinase
MASTPIDLRRLNGSALRSLVDGVPDGLLVVDANGTIRYLNAAASQLLRQPQSALVGSHFQVPLEPGEPVELEVDDPAGGRICELRVRRHEVGGESVFLVSLRDSTDEVRARRLAEAEADAKTELLTMIAHEFRNPLGTIVGCLSMLGEAAFEDRPEQRRRLLEMSQNKARELQRLVDDLLTSARIETGRLQPSPRAIDLREVMDAAVGRAEGRAILLSAQLTTVRPDRPVPVMVDPDQIGIALDNLVNNAFTYSDGSPWVEVRLDADGGSWATLTVTDHGIGVDDADRTRIFTPFERAVDGKRRGVGTGLGLSIARGLVDINRGRLELAHSRPGEGSTFVLRVPIDAA